MPFGPFIAYPELFGPDAATPFTVSENMFPFTAFTFDPEKDDLDAFDMGSIVLEKTPCDALISE
jgi:hypothetical protein